MFVFINMLVYYLSILHLLGTGNLSRVINIETRQTLDFNLILRWLLGNHIKNRNKGHENNQERHKSNQLTELPVSYIKYKSGAFLY